MLLKNNIKKSLDFIYNLITIKYSWGNKNNDTLFYEEPIKIYIKKL